MKTSPRIAIKFSTNVLPHGVYQFLKILTVIIFKCVQYDTACEMAKTVTAKEYNS